MKRGRMPPGNRPPPTSARRRSDATPFVIVVALGLFAFAGLAAIAIVPTIISDVDLDFDSFGGSSEETESPPVRTAATTTRAATPSPTPGLPAVGGSPFSLSALEKAWQARGLTLFSGEGAGGFSGTAVTPAAVVAQRAGESANLAVLVYPNAQVIKQDWTLSSGAAPAPAAGRALPPHQSIWWNQNVVVVFLSGPDSIARDAREAFLGL